MARRVQEPTDPLGHGRRERMEAQRAARLSRAGLTDEQYAEYLEPTLESTRQLTIQQNVTGSVGYGRLFPKEGT